MVTKGILYKVSKRVNLSLGNLNQRNTMNVALVFGHKQLPNGAASEQLMRRCERAIALQKSGVVDAVYVLAGVERCGVSMGREMELILLSRGVPRDKVICSFTARNTVQEVDGFLRLISASTQRSRHRLFAVSSWYHLPRILWLFWVRGRFVNLRAARRGGVSKLDLVLEVVKFLYNLADPFQKLDPAAWRRKARKAKLATS